MEEIQSQMSDEHFWDDFQASQSIVSEFSQLKEKTELYEQVMSLYQEVKDWADLYEQENDEEMLANLNETYEQFHHKLKDLHILVLFHHPYDDSNAILEFHPGAGGTESQDWASMLLRMYTRWAESHHFKYQLLDYQDGDEAGIKSATILIKGRFVYGQLKAEKGVHRLVRISPFDASARRHTSFASVDVMPEVKENVEVEILDKDLKIDTYHSQGAGGQNVNKTESAVRITHIPTGIVVSCQVDRSQLANKEMAMNMLRAHLYQRKLEEQEKELNALRGEQKNIEWGSQIRSYVFCPYTLVKDLRTGYEEGDVHAVMDGQLDGFLNASLEAEAKKE